MTRRFNPPFGAFVALAFSVCFASSSVSSAVAAPGSGASETLVAIAKARQSQKALVAKFTQERTIGLLSTKVTSTGTLTFVAPDRLRWDLDAPDDVSYWILPTGISYRTKSGTGSVAKLSPKMSHELDDVRALLGGDIARLRDRYDLVTTKGEHGEVTVDATPRKNEGDAGPAASPRTLSITLDRDLRTPLRAAITDGPKNRTDIVFGAVQKDATVPDATMTPPGDASKDKL